MLPQVATHVLHHTTRAVAAAPAVRNVLGSGTSPASHGAYGASGGHAGAGGSKYHHAGRGFYAGYTVRWI